MFWSNYLHPAPVRAIPHHMHATPIGQRCPVIYHEVVDEYAKRRRNCFCNMERSGSYSSTASATPCSEYLKTDEP
jgi:hypothetical protein